MKNNVITFLLIFVSLNSFSQLEEKNKAEYDFGNGINFSFNEGKYQFNIYGFIKPSYIYSDENEIVVISLNKISSVNTSLVAVSLS